MQTQFYDSLFFLLITLDVLVLAFKLFFFSCWKLWKSASNGEESQLLDRLFSLSLVVIEESEHLLMQTRFPFCSFNFSKHCVSTFTRLYRFP
jgi:hypothetical protein